MAFLRVFLLTLLALVAADLVIVGAIDPRNELYGDRFIPVRPNSRQEKLRRFEGFHRQRPVTGVVLGSSRTMKLDPALLSELTGKHFYNFGVFSGGVDDELAIWRYLRHAGVQPELIVIGVDQGAIGSDEGPHPELRHVVALHTELAGRTPTAWDRARDAVERYKSALTVSYTRDALEGVRVTLHPPLPAHEFRDDGLLRYVRWDDEIARGTFDRAGAIERCVAAGGDLTDRAAALPARPQAVLETLITEATAAGARVILWMPPYHPRAGARRDSSTGHVQPGAVDTYFLGLAARYDVVVLDHGLPGTLELDPTDWYDCTHFGATNAEQIVRRIVRAAADSTPTRIAHDGL